MRRDIARVYTEKKDYLAGKSLEEKAALLSKISYAQYLTEYCKLTPAALPFFQTFPHDLFCVGIDAVSAMQCYEAGDDYGSFTYPGFDGLGFPSAGKEEPYIYHFPDGNASIARLLVRSLIPAAMPGNSMEDVVTTRADYSKLDDDAQTVRIRLNSTVVHVRNEGGAGASKQVRVAYMRGGKLQAVTAKNCVLACYNMMIPYICEDIPPEQKKALSYLGEVAAGIHACGAAKLGAVCEVKCASHCGARWISHLHGAGFSGKPGHLQISVDAGGAGRAVHAADSLQTGFAATRTKSRRPPGTV